MHAGDGSCWCRNWEAGHPNDPSYYQAGSFQGYADNCDTCRNLCMGEFITGFAYSTRRSNQNVGVCFGGTASSNCDGCDRSSMDASRKNQSSNKADQGKQLKSQSPQIPVKR